MKPKIKDLVDDFKVQRKTYCLRASLAIFTALVVIGVVIATIIAIVFAYNGDAVREYSIRAPSTNSTLGSDAVIGGISMDINSREVSWDLQYTPEVAPVTHVYIMGPISVGTTTGPLHFAICGPPSGLACDTLTEPGRLRGTIQELSPGGNALKPYIQAVRDASWRFYVLVNDVYRAPLV